jgi:hypothetical protein
MMKVLTHKNKMNFVLKVLGKVLTVAAQLPMTLNKMTRIRL